jgi:hypothetical protein
MRGSRETTKSKRGHAPQQALAVWHGVAWHGGKLVIWDLLFLGGVAAICLVERKVWSCRRNDVKVVGILGRLAAKS